MRHKYTIADIEKGIEFLKKHCMAVYVELEFDELGRLTLRGGDLAGNRVLITIFDESTNKMPELTRTERL